MRTPTWAQVERFLALDGGWQAARQTKHTFYEKVLPDGRVLSTHVSHARSKSMHPDTFALICRLQLEVTVEEFWRTLETRGSARSEVRPPAAPRRPTLAMLLELRRKARLSDTQLGRLTLDEAKRLLDEIHSRSR